MPGKVPRYTGLDSRHDHVSQVDIARLVLAIVVRQLSKLEHVVQDILQRVTAVLDDRQQVRRLTEVFALDRFFEQLKTRHESVQRGPKLMTDRREKCRFRHVGLDHAVLQDLGT